MLFGGVNVHAIVATNSHITWNKCYEGNVVNSHTWLVTMDFLKRINISLDEQSLLEFYTYNDVTVAVTTAVWNYS